MRCNRRPFNSSTLALQPFFVKYVIYGYQVKTAETDECNEIPSDYGHDMAAHELENPICWISSRISEETEFFNP